MEKTPQTDSFHIGNTEFPQSTSCRSRAMKAESAAKRSGEDLIHDSELGLGGTPKTQGITHLRDENVLDEGSGDKRTRGEIPVVDAGDEVGCDFGLGYNGVKLAVPLAVGLKCEPEVLVAVDKLDQLGVESDGMFRLDGILFVGKEDYLGFGGGEVKAPFGTPVLDVADELAKDLVLS